MAERVVLAYSGGLDTSVAVRWMIENYGVEVIALVADIGQGGDWDALRNRALAAGAAEAIVADVRAEFADDYVAPALKANALYERRYPLVSSLSRPIIAKHQVEVAREHGADAVAHGCTGKGNDQVRFEVSSLALAPDLEVLAPVREWGMTREQCIDYAERYDIPITVTKEKLYSIDDNLWGRAIECGEMEDPWATPPADVWEMTREVATEPRDVVIGFEAGVPVSIDDEPKLLHELIVELNGMVGSYGWGRIDMVENRRVGIKSRETYEAPAGLALILAHQDLEGICLERDLMREKLRLESRYADLVYDGLWFSPLKQALDAFVDESQRHVTGEVRLRLEPGRCFVTGRRSDASLYDYGLATYDAADTFDHTHAEGFVRLWGLGVQTWAARQGGGRVDPPTTLWQGRFAEGPAEELMALSLSVPFDQRLVYDDITGSRAHVRGLHRAGLLSDEETGVTLAALDAVEEEFRTDRFEFLPSDEDIHTAVERRVTEVAGSVGAKLHTGRSRNDQVATDLRLYVKRELCRTAAAVVVLQQVLVERAEDAGEAYLPGYTHLQRAQPVLLAHHLLAHAWALARDVDRLLTSRSRLDESPLGAGALAGSSLPIDPAATAMDLGFARVFENSLDAVSDRDFVAEALFDLALLGVHLSRIAEEVILWASDEVGFLRLDDAFATGSSMLPQKKNPDVAELTRGKSGRLIGNLTGLLATLKGLPLAYNRDLQEDKEPLFDSLDQIRLIVPALTGLLATATFDVERMRQAADSPTAAATDLAELLVERGVPFREAHGIVGDLVRISLEGETPLADLVRAHDQLGPEAVGLVEPGASVRRRTTAGGGGPDPVRRQLARFRSRLADLEARLASCA